MPDQIGTRDVARGARGNRLPVPEHGDAIGNREDFFEPMRNVDDAGAGLAEDVDYSEQALDLAIGERGGRLVHNHDLGVDADRLGDLHELLLGHAQRFDETLRVNRGSDTRQELGGLTIACFPVDRPPRATTLEREGDVLSDGQVRKQRRLLIDRRDPKLPGGRGIHVARRFVRQPATFRNPPSRRR